MPRYFFLLMMLVFLQNLQALMNECIGHVIGKPHSPVTGLYIGKNLHDVTQTINSELNSVQFVILYLYFYTEMEQQ